MRRSSGTSCIPACAMRCGGWPARFFAVKEHLAGARRHHAHQALEGRRFTGAIASKQRHHFVLLDAQTDVEQDVRVAIIAVQTL